MRKVDKTLPEYVYIPRDLFEAGASGVMASRKAHSEDDHRYGYMPTLNKLDDEAIHHDASEDAKKYANKRPATSCQDVLEIALAYDKGADSVWRWLKMWKPYLHCCPEWDNLPIDRHDREFEACGCFTTKQKEFRRQAEGDWTRVLREDAENP